jgi:hypothetical protein
MAMAETNKMVELLAKVFDDAREDLRDELEKEGRLGDYEKIKRDFVFHMTDWADDLRRLHAMADAPDVWQTEEATRFLIGFLYHVVPHLNAAGRLLLDKLPDTFARDETAKLLAEVTGVGPTPSPEPTASGRRTN